MFDSVLVNQSFDSIQNKNKIQLVYFLSIKRILFIFIFVKVFLSPVTLQSSSTSSAIGVCRWLRPLSAFRPKVGPTTISHSPRIRATAEANAIHPNKLKSLSIPSTLASVDKQFFGSFGIHFSISL